jgi:hypothetical protein
MELSDDRLTLSRRLSELDRDVIEFTSLLDDEGVEYVIVSGYVAILTGRSRSTEDIDIVLEPLPDAELDRLADRLDDEGYWGMAMPLDEMVEMLGGGDRLRVAETGEMYPNFEVWLASNDLEREALSTAITAEVDGHEVSISSIELQIAYKLRLAKGAGTSDGKDFEDALHLYLSFEDQFKSEQLESYVEQLGVEDYYAELRGV